MRRVAGEGFKVLAGGVNGVFGVGVFNKVLGFWGGEGMERGVEGEVWVL